MRLSHPKPPTCVFPEKYAKIPDKNFILEAAKKVPDILTENTSPRTLLGNSHTLRRVIKDRSPSIDISPMIQQVFGLRNKELTLMSKKRNKTVERTNNRGTDDRLTHWASHRMATILPKVPVCQTLKEKIKSAIERRSRQVTEWFRDAVLDRPKLQNLKMLKAKAKRRWN
uniref:Uncharacterized protein n=1 Tax=Solanum tuberosum TaxID=4113 RepID=M1DS29_SOLTU